MKKVINKHQGNKIKIKIIKTKAIHKSSIKLLRFSITLLLIISIFSVRIPRLYEFSFISYDKITCLKDFYIYSTINLLE